jgi:hypothetical protein
MQREIALLKIVALRQELIDEETGTVRSLQKCVYVSWRECLQTRGTPQDQSRNRTLRAQAHCMILEDDSTQHDHT